MNAPDRSTVHSVIEPMAEECEVVRRLHDVSPYRVYEIKLDGSRAVLKIDAHPLGHAAAEGRVQEYVAERTTVPAPKVIAVGDAYFIAEWDDAAPAPGESEAVSETWARATGSVMGRLHAETAGRFETFGRPRAGGADLEIEGHETWPAAVRSLLADHRSYLVSVGHEDVAEAVATFFRDNPERLDGVGAPVLCHGNLLPDHAALRDDAVASVLDFEHAIVAPGEHDYWRTALPLFAGPNERPDGVSRAFREGYESVRSLPSDSEHRHNAYLLLNFVSYLESLHLQRNVGPGERADRAKRMRKRIFAVLEEERGRSG